MNYQNNMKLEDGYNNGPWNQTRRLILIWTEVTEEEGLTQTTVVTLRLSIERVKERIEMRVTIHSLNSSLMWQLCVPDR